MLISQGRVALVNCLHMLVCWLAGIFLIHGVAMAQNPAMAKMIDIEVQSLDGRDGKPLANQRLLVFTGMSENAVKSHAAHTSLITDKDGLGTLKIHPAETQWIQVWADGRVLCQPNPNQAVFSIATITSKGLATPNTCSALMRERSPGHFIVFTRPATLAEKMKQ